MTDRLAKFRTRKFCEPFAILILYCVLAVWSTWPLARSPLTTVPLGASPGATVPMFNVWTVWWNSDWFLSHPHQPSRTYWNAPIFHPTESAFAFSEPQPTTLAVAAVVWLTGSRILAYNIYLWLGLVLNAVLTWRLLRFLRVEKYIAAGGGAAMLLLPIVHWQRDVVQLLPVWGILWTWLALTKLGRRPSLRRGVEAGAAFGVSFLMCGHHGLFLAVLLAGTAWISPRRWRCRKTWTGLAGMLVVAGLLTGPVILALRSAAETHEFSRPETTVEKLSAKPQDYLTTYTPQLITPQLSVKKDRLKLSPGWLKITLAAIGIGFGLSRLRCRRWTIFLLATALLAFLLSLGTNLSVFEWQPWLTLADLVPGFSQVRSAFRFAFFVQMAAVLFAAQGLHWLLVSLRLLQKHRRLQKHRDSGRLRSFLADIAFLNRLTRRGPTPREARFRPWRTLGFSGTLIVLGAVATFETLPKEVEVAELPNAREHTAWIHFVRQNTLAGKAILCLPMAASNSVADFRVTADWMYFQTFHGIPMIDGYSGFFPASYFDLRRAVSNNFATPEQLATLTETNVDLVIVDRSRFDEEKLNNPESGSFFLDRVLQDDHSRIDVYRITKRPTP
ncbi:MAG: hypothetical protein O3C17_04250 [Planctomycetota bacterium]|nr:hypothetical protein [Planctomycetota bacterium]